MSRHFVTPRNPRHEVIVGWDAPLDTYFVQVFDTAIDDTAIEAPVAMVGQTLREVRCVDRILQVVALHALVPEKLRETLIADCRNEPHDPNRPGVVLVS